jgi:hypothetical protein
MTDNLTDNLEAKLYAALCEAENALDILRRGHGVEVSGLCYPALNSVRDALQLYRAKNSAVPVDK